MLLRILYIMERKDLTLIVVDAVSPTIDENSDLVQPNIQRLIDEELPKLTSAGLSVEIREYYQRKPSLKHKGEKIKTEPGIDYFANSSEIILTGGSMGGEQYRAFCSLLRNARNEGTRAILHMPFDCIYSFDSGYDSGESWTEAIFGNANLPSFENYKRTLKESGFNAQIIKTKAGAKPKKVFSVSSLYLWDKHEPLAEGILTRIARETATNLSREDDSDIISHDVNRLIQLGKYAVLPLQEFLSTEEKYKKDFTNPTPVEANYSAARSVLSAVSA